MVTTCVSIWVKPEHINEFIRETKLNHDASIRESGNLRFDVARCKEEPELFLLYEAYETEEAASHHKETEHYRRWKGTVEHMMARPREGVKYDLLFIE